MNTVTTLRAVVTSDNKVETDYGEAVRKDHITLGKVQGVHEWFETELYDHDSRKIMVNADMFTIDDIDESLKEQYPEDEEVIDQVKEIAVEEGVFQLEVIQ